MKISLVIPAYNEEKYIGSCLTSVIKNMTSDFLEVIVVDNASTDGTAAAAKKFPGVRVVYEPNKGLTKARQRGLMEAKGDLVAYIDADTRLSPAWPKILIEEFSANKNLVSLSGPPRYYDLSRAQRFLAEGLWKIFAPPTYWITGFMVFGANFAAKRESLLKIGGFDTNIAFHGEDTNIAWRLSKLGKAKFKMEFFVFTSGRRVLEDGIIKTFWTYGMNYLWMAIKHEAYTKKYADFR